ncbi:MAG: IucA/IucC family siderophore biosynthesis protein [Chloroflexi bacterium]|nr:IucA/IucC family siderophore biosynthesis protein [Chloroflexota bacterium]
MTTTCRIQDHHALAEQTAVERLLNAYLRETGKTDPQRILSEPLPRLSSRLKSELADLGAPFCLRLGDVLVLGALTYISPLGHHQYAPQLWIKRADELWLLDDVADLAAAIIADLAVHAPVATQDLPERRRALVAHIQNSVSKTALYIAGRRDRGIAALDLAAADRMERAEQSLIFGHPFHPTPKSSEGWSAADVGRYAPELAASFQLHYLAAAPELVVEDRLWVGSDAPIPEVVLAAAHVQGVDPTWRLLACHPWQAGYLAQQPEIQALLAANKLRDLGPLGATVWPTSSVRTVWQPSQPGFYKLPLDIRITNLVRVNALDELKRSLDTSRIVDLLAAAMPTEGCTILRELGYRTLWLSELPTDRRAALAASFGVLFREAPPVRGSDAPMVLAALLEPPLDGTEPPLIHALRQAAQGRDLTPDLIERWVERYLTITLLPLLRWWTLGGVSLEAHVQNSMLALTDGWPVHLYVRDLEGASISRERAGMHGWYGGLLPKDSPALYDDDAAWHRFKYYVLVNQLGHVLFTLARYTGCEELWLWQIARSLLQHEAARYPQAKPYVDDLLESPELFAKANLISKFAERGETPLYVPLPNPLHHTRMIDDTTIPGAAPALV